MRKSEDQAPGQPLHFSRRAALGLGGACAAGILSGSAFARGNALNKTRSVALHNRHTGEFLRAEFRANGKLIPDALAQINHVLRDHRTDEISPIDPALLDLLHALQRRLESREPFHVISAYRSPDNEAKLLALTGGVPGRSLHMHGKAADIMLPGRSLADLRRAALSLHAGGVGYHRASGFIHVDTGRVQHWS